MATNKHAMIRYKALDKCFRNMYKQYYIEDLIAICSDAIYDFDGTMEGISRRTVLYDISFMRSESGWNAPIEGYLDGRKKYYRYSNPSFSIDNRPLTDDEVSQLKETLLLLDRFKGQSGFDRIEEFITNLEDKLGLKGNGNTVVGYEQNPYLTGIERLTPIFNLIVNEQPVRVSYCTFAGKSIIWNIHPYYLKQYNSRWYLFGIENEKRYIVNVPLDRIEDIAPVNIKYIPNTDIDFDEYFEDIVGVSFPHEAKLCEVRLRFDQDRFPYVLSKPIHPSMRVINREEGIVELSVIPNNELESIVLSFGDQVEVLSPETFRKQIANNIISSLKKYLTVQDGCTSGYDLCNVEQK